MVDRGKKRSGPSLRVILVSDICGYIRSVEMSGVVSLASKAKAYPKATSRHQRPRHFMAVGGWLLKSLPPSRYFCRLESPHVRLCVVDGDGVDGEPWMVEDANDP